jgi:2-iminoacetate synthase ThiH
VSVLVDRAIDDAGLSDLAVARRSRALSAAEVERLRAADLLALGALADRVRAEDVGHEVTIHTAEPAPPALAAAPLVVLPRAESALTGLELLREVAVTRISGPRGQHVRIDWAVCGLELAQVALGFGADELVGRIVNKRGLPLGEGELLGVGKKSRLELADVVKRKELADFVRRAGRIPVFTDERGVGEATRPGPAAQETA